MSTTVEALEQAYKIINKGLPVTDPEVWGISRQLREAIPHAELEEQAVEMLKHVTSALDHTIKFAGTRTFLIKQKTGFLDLMTEARKLSAQIAALTGGTPNVNKTGAE